MSHVEISHVTQSESWRLWPVPLTEEIILTICGSPDHYRNPVRSFECRWLTLLTWKFVGNFGDSRDNVFDMYGDSRENLLEILAVVIIWSTISFVRGYIRNFLARGRRRYKALVERYMRYIIHTRMYPLSHTYPYVCPLYSRGSLARERRRYNTLVEGCMRYIIYTRMYSFSIPERVSR